MIPLGIMQPPQANADLWTPIGKPWLILHYDMAVASSILLNGSNIAQLDDLSGNGRHGVQTNLNDQSPYNSSDSRAGGQPSMGPLTRDGRKGVLTPTVSARRVYASVGFKDGLATTFDEYNALWYGNGDSNGTHRVIGRIGSNDWFSNATTFAGTSRINGNAESPIVLPLPHSVVVVSSATLRTQTYSVMHAATNNGRTFAGPMTSWSMTSGDETDDDRDKFESWIADRKSISLVGSHPYSSGPPSN